MLAVAECLAVDVEQVRKRTEIKHLRRKQRGIELGEAIKDIKEGRSLRAPLSLVFHVFVILSRGHPFILKGEGAYHA
jgi:hypothetical protein